ncbi:MAG: 50S ribosomal protein L20 [Candidatus Izimaplasma sp.]|nr:50S ribosomal protein L20 [Candidatus Izimaplasma bacterium]
MPRVKGGNVARKRRKKVLKLAKGYFGSKRTLYRTAHEQVMNSLAYAYRDRKQRKRNFRKLWITRINAAARQNGLSYSRLVYGLRQAGVEINRKMLADIAVNDEQGFTDITDLAKDGIAGNVEVTEEKTEVKEAIKPETKEETKEETKKAEKTETTSAEYTEKELKNHTVVELTEIAKEKELSGYSSLRKAELIELILNN